MAMATGAAFPGTSEARISGEALVRSMFIDYLKVVPFDGQVKAVYSLVLEERDLLSVQPTGAGKSLEVMNLPRTATRSLRNLRRSQSAPTAHFWTCYRSTIMME